MNGESSPTYDQPQHPRHRNDARLDSLTPERATELAPEEAEALLREGHEKYGEAFAAYLSIPGVTTRRSLLLDFHEDHLGTFADMRLLCEYALESLGYDDLLNQILNAEPDLDGLLTWDYDLLAEYLHGVYDIVERGGILYAFAR